MHACVCVCVTALLLMLYRVKESRGWRLVFTTPYLERPPQKIAINAKVIGNGLGDKMLAYSTGMYVHVCPLVMLYTAKHSRGKTYTVFTIFYSVANIFL